MDVKLIAYSPSELAGGRYIELHSDLAKSGSGNGTQ